MKKLFSHIQKNVLRAFLVVLAWIKPPKHSRPDPMTPKQKTLVKRFLAVLLAFFVAGSFVASIEFGITVDGAFAEATAYTSLAELYASYNTVQPGDFVAVDGSVITPGGGSAFTASVNGKTLSPAEAKAYTIRPGDAISYTDGTDISEPYQIKATEPIQPKLERQGEVGSVSYVAEWPKAGRQETRFGYLSGKTAEVEAEPAQNAVVVTKNIYPKDGERVVALTFDDGPSEYSERYLDILQGYGAHATFFELGREIEGKADITKALKDAGMQVGTHSFGHEEASKLSPEDLQNTLRQGIQVLHDDADVLTSMLRPPYGDFTRDAWLNSGGVVSSTITWTQDSQDWKRPGVDEIYAHALANIRPGSIILMHDGGGNRDQDVEALPRILQTLSDQGYRVVSVAELLATDPSIPESIASGSASMPEDSVWPTEFAN